MTGPDAEPELPFDVGRFHVVEQVGRGGMGVVYAAEDTRLKRRVALKLLPRDIDRDEPRRQRLLREAQSAAAVTHPNVATVYEVGEADGRTFIAMELVEGVSLRKRLERGRLTAAEVLRIARGIALALERAHEKGVVHRDLKPDNVMLAPGGDPKVLDFGLAKMRDDALALAEGESTQSVLTREGTILGTPGYMAPEQILGKPVDARADVFAFGVVLYEMATSVRAFGGGSTMEVLVRVQRDEPPKASSVEPRIDERVERVIEKCLAKKPEARFANGGELVEALEGLDAAEARRPRRRGLVAALAVAAVIVGAVGLELRAVRQPAPAQAAATPSASVAPSAPATSWWDYDPQTTSPEALRAFKAGMKSLREGTGQGNINLRKAIALDPDFAAANLVLAISLWCQAGTRQNFVKAMGGHDRLGARDAALVDAYEPLCLHDPPDPTELQRRMHALTRRFPDDPWVWAHLEEDRPEAQLAAIDHAIALDPGYANAYTMRADILLSQGDSKGAVDAYERCLAVSPVAANCQTMLTQRVAQTGDCARVEREARRAILLDAAYQTAWIQLASSIALQGQPLDGAREVLHQAESKLASPGDDLAGREALLEAFAGDFPTALRRLDEHEAANASMRESEHAFTALAIVRVAAESGDDARARRVAERYLARRSAWEPLMTGDVTVELMARLRRAGVRTAADAARNREARLAQWPAAIDVFGTRWVDLWASGVTTADDAREALAARPDAAAGAGSMYDGGFVAVGETYLLAGRVDEAIPWLEASAHACNVLESPVSILRARLLLGEAREKKGDAAGACAEYDAVLSRWGAARPRSVTAEEARLHHKALQCPHN
jgi:serine/threonine-protein kinase